LKLEWWGSQFQRRSTREKKPVTRDKGIIIIIIIIIITRARASV